jgi:hypothetical protein
MHLYRWDLDRTYLDTDIRSVRGLVRSALESADDKRNVPGAAALLRGLLASDPSARASIISGSPVQMRAVLERKLTLDGIRFESMVLKDNLRNLRRGRLRALRGQLGYKLPQLLSLRLGRAREDVETLFGDDAEVDALIYALYADAIAGRVDEDTLVRVLRAGGAYPDQVAFAVRSLERLPRAAAVDGIYIVVDRGLPLATYDKLGGAVTVVFSWFQAALSLHARGQLNAAGLTAVVEDLLGGQGETPAALAALAADAVRRRLIAARDLDALPDGAWVDDARKLIALLEPPEGLRAPTHHQDREERRDWLGFLRDATA